MWLALIWLLLVLMAPEANSAHALGEPQRVPFRTQARTVDRISNGLEQRSYVVVLKEDAPGALTTNRTTLEEFLCETAGFDTQRLREGQIPFVYHIVNPDPTKVSLRGFAVWADSTELKSLRKLPGIISFIEEDAWDQEEAYEPSEPDWGQVRIDERMASTYKKSYEKIELPNKGEGAAIWVLDGGVYAQHQEFIRSNGTTRVTVGPDFASDEAPSATYNDCRGHGTHVASSAAGKYRGVATEAKLISLRITNCAGAGSKSASCAAMQYASQYRRPRKSNIIAMSVGGLFSEFQNSCVDAVVDSGIMFVASAGNTKSDACDRSPASASKAITVGSVDKNEQFGSYSCWGSCVNVLAPGVDVDGADITAPDGYSKKSGTSMSCPFVAGALAIYGTKLSDPSSIQFDTVMEALNTYGTKNVVSNLRSDTPNLIVYDRWDDSGYNDGGNGAGSGDGGGGGGSKGGGSKDKGGKDKQAVSIQLTVDDLAKWEDDVGHQGVSGQDHEEEDASVLSAAQKQIPRQLSYARFIK